MNVIVTGGAGFIGSHLVKRLLAHDSWHNVMVLDKLTYAGKLDNLPMEDSRLIISRCDVADRGAVRRSLELHKPELVFHLAAETHVTRSLDHETADVFFQSNLLGTYIFLDECLRYQLACPALRVVYVSTDEVYGSLGKNFLPWSERSPYEPTNPYSASKAGADFLARAWHLTWGLNVITVHGSNNYGTHQNEEKLIPAVIDATVTGREVIIHGDGQTMRDWLHVDDFVDALMKVAAAGIVGKVYNIPGQCERTVLDIVGLLLVHLRHKTGPAYKVTFAEDRPGNDRRYAMELESIKGLGWMPGPPIEDRILPVIDWYLGRLGK